MNMIVFLFLLPLLAIVSASILYRHNGKHEIMKFDLVQFVYAFVLMPLVFVWMKSFIFVSFKQQLNLGLSVTELFVVDTVFSTMFLFISAFVVIHSLTKSFDLRRVRDPLYDIFSHSEFFHQMLSHLAIYMGVALMMTGFALINLWVPFEIEIEHAAFYGVMGLAFLTGIVGFLAIWKYEAPSAMFMRIMKLLIGFCFVLHGIGYLVSDVSFKPTYSAYWFSSFAFLAMVMMAVFAERLEPDPEPRWLKRLPFKLNWRKGMYYWRFAWKQLAKVKS